MMTSSMAQSTLKIKAFVESYFSPLSLTMKAIIDPISAPLLFDTITIELHKPSDLSLVFSKKKVFDIFGNASITLPEYLMYKYYYIVLRHRNSIEIWSQKPILIQNSVNFDFTTSVTQAYGNNLKWVANAACMYSGDINQDGHINLLDFNLWDHDNTNFIYGYYLNTDLNGDGNVDLSDFPFWDSNFYLGVSVIHPTLITEVVSEEIIYDIYPNPANQFLQIRLSNITVGATIEMFELKGALVSLIPINSDITKYIDVSKYASGVYLLKLNNNGQVINKKILIEH